MKKKSLFKLRNTVWCIITLIVLAILYVGTYMVGVVPYARMLKLGAINFETLNMFGVYGFILFPITGTIIISLCLTAVVGFFYLVLILCDYFTPKQKAL